MSARPSPISTQRSQSAGLRRAKSSSNSLLDRDPQYIGSPKSNASAAEMLDVKHNRKRAESDLQLLANRIALLRVEEQKALNKVHETKARAEEILLLKRRNEEHIQTKIALNLEREIEVRETQRKAQVDREERQRKLALSRRLTVDTKRELADRKKQESAKLAEVASHGRVMGEMEKRVKAEDEKRRREQLRRLKEAETAEKLYQAQILYAKKAEEEAARKKEAEDMILLLENEEKELIRRLKRSQELQQQAYITLKKSLES